MKTTLRKTIAEMRDIEGVSEQRTECCDTCVFKRPRAYVFDRAQRCHSADETLCAGPYLKAVGA